MVRVPFFRSDVGEREIELVTEVLRSGHLTTGPMAERFESEFAAVVDAQHAVAVSACTTGLQAALIAMGVGAVDEVITTPFTFCGTVQAIEEAGATPVFVDIGHDLNIDCGLLEEAVTEKTRAIVPVHVGGLLCDLDAIGAIAKRYRLAVVEDAAHAFGSEWHGRAVGSSGSSCAVFSFYANKNLTSGEGGMITTADGELAARLRRMVRHGAAHRNKTGMGWEYEVVERGFKFNMPDVAAAIGVAQLERAQERAKARGRIADFYNESLADLEEVELPPVDERGRHSWHLYIVRLRLEALEGTRDEVMRALERAGVQCSVHFRPIPMHAAFAKYGWMGQWPVSRREYERVISLPIFPSMTEEEQAAVVGRVREVVIEARRESVSASAGGQFDA